MSKRDEEFHRHVDDILTFLALAVPARDVADLIRPGYFDRAVPLTAQAMKGLGGRGLDQVVLGELSADERDRLPEESYWDRILNRSSPMKAQVAIDYACVCAPPTGVDTYSLFRTRQITSKEARGKVGGQCRFNFKVSRALIGRDGLISESRHTYAGYSGSGWHGDAAAGGRESAQMASLMSAFQIQSEPFWKVRLGYEGYPRLSFTTDPIGVRAAFRLRDIPEGKTRRDALRHWVTEHWRDTGSGERSEVRKHLRGKVDFTWNGLRCEIEPSLADRRENMEDVKVITPENLESVLGDA